MARTGAVRATAKHHFTVSAFPLKPSTLVGKDISLPPRLCWQIPPPTSPAGRQSYSRHPPNRRPQHRPGTHDHWPKITPRTPEPGAAGLSAQELATSSAHYLPGNPIRVQCVQIKRSIRRVHQEDSLRAMTSAAVRSRNFNTNIGVRNLKSSTLVSEAMRYSAATTTEMLTHQYYHLSPFLPCGPRSCQLNNRGFQRRSWTRLP